MGKTALFALMVLALVLASCSAPKVALNAQRAPNLNTSGIQSIAVMPFRATHREHQSIAQHATNVVAGKIQETNKFKLISPMMVMQRQRANQSFDDLVDALFVGQITLVDSETNSNSGQRKTKNGMVKYTTFHLTVQVEFTYSLVRARDGSITGPVTKRGSTNASSDNPHNLPSVESLARKIIDEQMTFLYRDIVPYTVTITRSLAKEADKTLQPQMDSVLVQVKAGNYAAARDAYIAIYESSKSIAAAENASISHEALGETRAAADLMRRVAAETGNPKAREILARLEKELLETAAVGEYKHKDARSSAEMVAGVASDEVRKYLPDSARVWIINNSAADDALINSVIDNMASAFLQSDITVVDRQNTDLIQAEQKFQISGHVNDSDIVGIGNLAGVNRIVVLSITGTGAMRRLQVRVLDVQTGTLLMQSNTDEKWSL